MENKKEVPNVVKLIFFALNLIVPFALFKVAFIDKEPSNLSISLFFLYLFLSFFLNFKYRKEQMAALSTINKTVVWTVMILSFALAFTFIIWKVKG